MYFRPLLFCSISPRQFRLDAVPARWGPGGPSFFSPERFRHEPSNHMGSWSGKAGSLSGCLEAERFHMVDLLSENVAKKRLESIGFAAPYWLQPVMSNAM